MRIITDICYPDLSSSGHPQSQLHDPDTHIHIMHGNAHSFISTPAFTAINSHLGITLGRHDNLESLVYLSIYLLRGSLPWICHRVTSSTILDMKLNTDKLFCGVPDQFCQMLNYLQCLTFHAKPDYDYLQTLIQELCLPLSDVKRTSADKTQSKMYQPGHAMDTGIVSRDVELCM